MGENGEIRLGIVGMGYWGPRLYRCFDRISGVRIVALCDKKKEQLSRIKAQYPAQRLYENYYEMAQDDDIDGVIIAAPASTHFDIGMAMLGAKKHILLEKPMADSLKKARALFEASKGAKRLLMVGHTYLYSPAAMAVKSAIDQGTLGEIRHITMKRSHLGMKRKDINAIWDLAPHDISLLIQFFGRPHRIWGEGFCLDHGEIIDKANLFVAYPGGLTGEISVSWALPPRLRQIIISGTENILLFDDDKAQKKISVYPAKQLYSSGGNESYFQNIAHEENEPLLAECEDFIRCIRYDKRPIASAEHGLEVVEILEKAQNFVENKAK